MREVMEAEGITYVELAKRLETAYSEEFSGETARNLRLRISRGRFSFAMVLQILEVMGCRQRVRYPPEDA